MHATRMHDCFQQLSPKRRHALGHLYKVVDESMVTKMLTLRRDVVVRN